MLRANTRVAAVVVVDAVSHFRRLFRRSLFIYRFSNSVFANDMKMASDRLVSGVLVFGINIFFSRCIRIRMCVYRKLLYAVPHVPQPSFRPVDRRTQLPNVPAGVRFPVWQIKYWTPLLFNAFEYLPVVQRAFHANAWEKIIVIVIGFFEILFIGFVDSLSFFLVRHAVLRHASALSSRRIIFVHNVLIGNFLFDSGPFARAQTIHTRRITLSRRCASIVIQSNYYINA